MICLAKFWRAVADLTRCICPGPPSEGQIGRQAGGQAPVIPAYLHLPTTTESRVKIRLHERQLELRKLV